MTDSTMVKVPVRNKRTWTPNEDEKLIDALMELHATGKYGADNGFKPGYFQAVQNLLDISLPNSGLKAEPHIKSRLKTLKTHFSIMYDMIAGSSTSGFGWDHEKCVVTAPNDVWDEYVKVYHQLQVNSCLKSLQSHKGASLFRDKPFPCYQKLCTIFGKDRATGSRATDLSDEEVVVETQETMPVDLEDMGVDTGVDSSLGGKGYVSKKRKRDNGSDEFIHVYADTSNILNNTMTAIGNDLNNILSKLVADGTPNVDLMKKVQSEINNLPGITFDEAFEATQIIGKCPLDAEMFFGYDQEKKVWMVQKIARKSSS